MPVEFYDRFVMDKTRSDREKKVVGDDVCFMKRWFANDRSAVTDRAATPEDQATHPAEYAAYVAAKTKTPTKAKKAKAKAATAEAKKAKSDAKAKAAAHAFSGGAK